MSFDYTSAIEYHPECVLALAGNGGLIKLNEKGLRLFEAGSFSEVKDACFFDFVAAEHRAAVRGLLRRVLEGKAGTLRLELIGLRRTHRWLEMGLSPVADSRGVIGAALGILRDVSEVRKTQQELARLNGALNESTDAVFVTDDDFRLVYVNNTACRSLDCCREELLSKSAAEINPNITPEVIDGLRKQMRATGRLPAIETSHRARDGRVFPVAATFSGLNWEKKREMLCIARDLAEHKRLEADLWANEASLVALMKTVPDFIARYDQNCRHIGVNSALQALLGLPLEKIIGRTPEELPLRNTESLMEALRGVLATGRQWCGELACTDPAGKVRSGEFRIVPEFGRAKNVLGATSIWRDTTERRELQDRLRQAQKLEAIGQLASGVAHDFNNMLAAILLHVSLLRTNPRVPGDLAEIFNDLEEEVRRAISLPRQLLMFSRQQAMEPAAISMESVVETMLKMLRRIVGELVEIEFRPMPGPPRIFADPGMMEQVILNLCLNARDAMPEGGRITLTTSLVEVDAEHAAKAKGARPGLFVRFAVADTGRGMDGPTLSRIFEPFFTTKERGRGTGLGLATVLSIVQQHQGWIEVKSSVGQGTTFFIFLPAYFSTEAGRPCKAKRPPPPRGGGEIILLVEDDAGLRQVLAAMIARGGYRVLEAGNGLEAADIWSRRGKEIDLLFTDLVIPGGLTGLELAKKFKQARPGLKAVLCSGYRSAAAQAAECEKWGIVFLSKPFVWEELAKTLETMLHQSAS